MNNIRVAILGATSHIAKGLINNFLGSENYRLFLFTRSSNRARFFLSSIGKSSGERCVVEEGYDAFYRNFYDVIINCVGVGTARKLGGEYFRWFTVTEEFDNLAIGYLREIRPETLYISLSSGAVYGRSLTMPAAENSVNQIQVNHLTTEDYYAMARLNAETKHRAFGHLSIVDLRVFSYFSRFIDFSDGYFITEVLDCILKDKVLATNEQNIVRDYVHPQDLFSLIRKCMDAGGINDAFDVLSAEAVEKQAILDFFQHEYGLMYEINPQLNLTSGTGSKNIYCSNYNKALKVGNVPKFSSLETIQQESKFILSRVYKRRN